MAKLVYTYGPVSSSKTADLLITNFNLSKIGNTILLKPKIDTRYGSAVIQSRIGISSPCHSFEDFKESLSYDIIDFDYILVDEVQFLSEEDVLFLCQLVDYNNITVLCCGLKTDFRGELFEGSKTLLEHADEIRELETYCWCGKKATHNARVINGEVVKMGEQVMIGADEYYQALCRLHWNSNMASSC